MFEKIEWLGAPGEGLNYAPHLKVSPLPGVPAKKVLWQFPIGDRTNPNPTETAFVRAAGMRDTTRIYRADLAFAAIPATSINPHAFILDITNLVNLPVALAAQSQVVGFIATGGNVIPNPSPTLAGVYGVPNLFEAPEVLPETLNFLTFPLPALTSLSTSSAPAGGPGFTLSLTGSNFTTGSIVLWNGRPRATSPVSATRITAAILASDLATPGAAQVSVFNPLPGGGMSNAMPFTISTGPVTPAPSFSAGGVVNSAGFGALLPAPGAIASIFGANFATSTATAATSPLPTTLAGVSVEINGLAVPLLAVSPQQINFQVPWYLQEQTQATMTIVANGVTSNPMAVALAKYSPAVFSTNQQGAGQGVVLIGNTGLIAAPRGMFPGSQPAKRGDSITVLCTGLGPVNNQPVAGSPAPAAPAAATATLPSARIGGGPATVSFAGLAPGFVGVYQVTIQVPVDAPVGDAVPVVLSIGGMSSNAVTIAVE